MHRTVKTSGCPSVREESETRIQLGVAGLGKAVSETADRRWTSIGEHVANRSMDAKLMIGD